MKDNPNTLWAAAKSAGKLILKCRRPTLPAVSADEGRRGIVILGNGPSLRDTVDKDWDALARRRTMAVNFMGLAPEFVRLKPSFYLMADPVFFNPAGDERVARLYKALENADWPLTLLVPHDVTVPRVANKNVAVGRFNNLGVEAPGLLRDIVYDRGWGMPRPRNVLIPAIMTAAHMGYKNIWIVGADHSWPRTIGVDAENHVIPDQPHFYAEDPEAEKRTNAVYTNLKLHEVLASMVVAFRGYHEIERWARRRGITVTNSTPVSLIDAFRRGSLPKD